MSGQTELSGPDLGAGGNRHADGLIVDLQIELPASSGGEKRDGDFAVDVFGRAVGVRLAAPRHDDGPYQSGSHVLVFVNV